MSEHVGALHATKYYPVGEAVATTESGLESMKLPGVVYHRVNQRPSNNGTKPIVPVLTTARHEGHTPIRKRGHRKKPRSSGKSSGTKLGHCCGRSLSDSWMWELIGIFVCISTLVSIFGILLVYDQKPMPHNIAGLSLNTIISVLATVSRATTISVAARIVAQQKWVRFVRAALPLTTVELYDDATRGPLGSMFLLFCAPRSTLATVIALVTVLALGFEPFVQQSLSFPPRETPTDRNIPVLRTTANISYSNSDLDTEKTVLFNSLLLQALFADSVEPLQPPCSTSSCHWPSYVSAAMCSACTDIPLDQVKISSTDTKALTAFITGDFLDDFQSMANLSDNEYIFFTEQYSVSTNYNVSFGTGAPFLMAVNFTGTAYIDTVEGQIAYAEDIVWNAADRPAPYSGINGDEFEHLDDMDGPLTVLGYVRLDRLTNGMGFGATSASQCVISLCAREQTSYSINGTFSRNITDQMWGNYTNSTYLTNNEGDYDTGYTWSAQSPQQELEATDGELVMRLDKLITSLSGFSTRNISANYSRWVGYGDTWYTYGSSFADPPSNTLRYITDPTNSSAKIAQVFTNYFEQRGDLQIKGQAYETVSFVNVRWAWLSFPSVLVLMCSITLFISIYQSRQIGLPTWKTSPFPLLFGYHDREQELKMTTSSLVGNDEAGVEGTENEESSELQRETMLPRVLPEGDSTSHYADWASKSNVRLTKRDRRWIFETDS